MATYMIDGRLTNDAEMKGTSNGREFMTFNVAWNYGKDKKTHYYSCTMDGSNRTSKILPYMRKGKYVIVTGEPYWTEYNGKTYEYIRAMNISFVGGESEKKTEDAGWGHTYPYTENGLTFQNEQEYDKYMWDGTKPSQSPSQSKQDDFDDLADIPF